MKENFDRKKHWENIYDKKQMNEVSWFQPIPGISINLIKKYNLLPTAKIIDVGGGDSFLVDHLFNMGYENISVLDISEAAINKAKKRLGKNGDKINWLIADAAQFKPDKKFDLWHDRATFHFLTSDEEILNYVNTASQSINLNGILIIGTFSDEGPEKCSGIEIKQYSESKMNDLFKDYFEKIECFKSDHKTPTGATQNFIYCVFKKIKGSL